MQATSTDGSIGWSGAHALCGNHKIWICLFGLGRLSKGLARKTPIWTVWGGAEFRLA